MRYHFEINLREAMLIVCAAALAGLVYEEGWTWPPLKAAAVMIPVSLLTS